MRFTVKTFTKQCYKVLKTQVLKLRPSYDLWSTSDAVELRDFQKEVLREAQKVWNKKKIAAVEVFCAGGKTIMAAWLAVEHLKLHPENRVVFCSPKRDAFLHFEAEFRKVLSTHGLREDLVYARHSTSMPVFPVDKRVLIAAPYDLVGPAAMNGTRKVIEETLKRTKLFIADEVHRYPGDAENTTEIIGKIYPLVQELAIPHGARVLTMTGTHYRACDDKHPFGIEKPDIKRTLQDMILFGSAPQLCGFPIPIEIKVRNGEIKRSTDTIHLKFHRRKLLRYLGLIADTILKVVEIEAEFAKSKGAAKPGGHAIAVSRQKEAVELCAILNRRLGWEAFVAYTADALKREECLEVQEKLRDGRLLGYATVMKGVESINVPRLKYAHIVARITSDNKLMQFVGRVLRLPGDADCALIKNTAVVLDYQVKKLRIIRLAKGIRDIQRQGGSLVPKDSTTVGGDLFKARASGEEIKSLSLGAYEVWLKRDLPASRGADTRSAILFFIKRYRRFPSRRNVARRCEKRLGNLLYTYCCPTSRDYCETFKCEVDKLAVKYKLKFPWRVRIDRGAELLAFIRQHKRLPTLSAARGSLERSLAIVRYDCRYKCRYYDADLSGAVEALCKELNIRVYINRDNAGTQVKILNFIEQHKRLPMHFSKDPLEKLLGASRLRYCKKGKSSFDKKFKIKFDRLCNRLKIRIPSFKNPEQRKNALARFIKRFKRLPTASAKCVHERSLHSTFERYCQNDTRVDIEFKHCIEALCKRLGIQKKRDPEKRLLELIHFIETKRRKPRAWKADKKEKSLAVAFWGCLSTKKRPMFKNCALVLRVRRIIKKYNVRYDLPKREAVLKAKILAFIKRHRRRPCERFARERRLASAYRRFCSRAENQFDKQFSMLAAKLLKKFEDFKCAK